MSIKDKLFSVEYSLVERFAERHGCKLEVVEELDSLYKTLHLRVLFPPLGKARRSVGVRVIFETFLNADKSLAPNRVNVAGWSSSTGRKSHESLLVYKVLCRRWEEWQRKCKVLPSRRRPRLDLRDVSKESRSRGHRNACAVCALSWSVPCRFEDADAFWRLYGARESDVKGTYSIAGLRAADPKGGWNGPYNLDLLGVRFLPVDGMLGKTLHRAQHELARRGGRYFVMISGHALACVDGVYYDTANSSPMARVQQVFQVVPVGEE